MRGWIRAAYQLTEPYARRALPVVLAPPGSD